MMLYNIEYPFGQFGSVVLLVPRLKLHILNELASSGKKKILILCKCCSTIVKTLVCYQHHLLTNPKHSAIQGATK